MADQYKHLLSRTDFLTLANRAGFTLSEADLAQLTRRNLVRPHDGNAAGEPRFHLLHLYLVALYFEAVRPIRHPWTTVAPEMTLQEIAARARDYRDLVSKLVAGEAVEGDELAGEIREYAQSINPFGPLASVVGQLRREALAELRGDGVLYVQLIELVELLGCPEAPVASELEPAREAEPDDEQERGAVPTEEFASMTEEIASMEDEDDIAVTQTVVLDEESETIEPELAEESEAFEPEPIEEPNDEPEEVPNDEPEVSSRNPFTREDSEVTTRTQDLQSRLDRLRSRDKEIARKRSQPLSGAVDDAVDDAGDDAGDELAEAAASEGDEPDELHARIAELNQLREKYLAEQRWEDLAELYEDGIELFVDPVERQQVFLTLAMVYELKLERVTPAFERFLAAYLVEGTRAGKEKAFEGLQRLGRQPAIEARYVEFLEEQLAGGELGQLPDEIFEPMAVRAARHHADLGEVGLAMEYYERVLERLPEHEVAFHSLAQLYEDAGRLTRLMELYRAKIARRGPEASASLRSELSRIEEMAGAATAVD